MQTFFLIVLGLYSALVLLRFGVNMWNMLTLNATKYNLIQLQLFTQTRKMYSVNHEEYARLHIEALVKYFITRFVVVSVLWVLVVKFL